ncbi:MAG: sigma 54-interacting transcriptional regulator [Gammaproteobacteria bacterium]|nr:sigma 54-interacting transcriptional regulator [Gammaproteobacteria bacterium]
MKSNTELLLNDNWRQVLDALDDGVTIYDRAATLVWANNKACEILGTPREQMIGLNISEIATLPTVATIQTTEFGGYSDRGIDDLRRIRRDLASYASPGYMVFKNGTRMLYIGKIIPDSAGNPLYAVFTQRDTSALDEGRKRIAELEKLTNLYRDQLDILHPVKNAHSVVYASSSMQQILERASKVARMDSTVLITGETGVGKNLLATYLHRTSARAQGPLIHVNCACLPESLIEAELFGYVEGSFSGASRKGRRGLIEIAEGGTLFLDEITELPIAMQAKLLSVIEDHTVRRLGAERWQKTDLRIIAATNRDAEELRAGRVMRVDLFYRLAMSTIHITPLRQRTDDIPPLANHFLMEFNEANGTNLSLHPALVEAFTTLPLPGNVREIKNLIWQIALEYTPDSDPLMQVTIPPEAAQLLLAHDQDPRAALHTAAPHPSSITETRSENAVEAAQLRSLAECCGGDVYEMARQLEVHRTTVIRKLKRYGIAYARSRRGVQL